MSMVPTVDRYFLLLALILQTSKCILFESYPFTFSMSSLKQHTQYFMYSRVLFDHIFVCKMYASKWSPQKFAHSPSTWLDPAKYLIQDVTPGGGVILSGRIVRFWREHLKNGYIRLISYQLGFFPFLTRFSSSMTFPTWFFFRFSGTRSATLSDWWNQGMPPSCLESHI